MSVLSTRFSSRTKPGVVMVFPARRKAPTITRAPARAPESAHDRTGQDRIGQLRRRIAHRTGAIDAEIKIDRKRLRRVAGCVGVGIQFAAW